MNPLVLIGALAGAAWLLFRREEPSAPADAAPLEARLWSIDWTWPVPQSTRVSSPFGWRVSPFDASKSQFHPGIDIAAALGEPVYAAAPGVVVESRYSESWGNRIVLEHEWGFRTTYNHLNDRLLEVGDVVEAEGLIGWCGTTGRSTGPHVHFELIVEGSPVDPALYIQKDPA